MNVPKIGRHRVRLLVSNMGMDITPFELSIKELCTVNGIDKKSAQQIKNYKDFDYGIQELEAATKFGISIVSFWDDHYPMLLKKIYNPPVILYCKGQPLWKFSTTKQNYFWISSCHSCGGSGR